MDGLKRWVAILGVLAVWGLLVTGFVVFTFYLGSNGPSSEPAIARPSIITFHHPTGSLTCGSNEAGISCVPTWWLIPAWESFEKAKALYELKDADGY